MFRLRGGVPLLEHARDVVVPPDADERDAVARVAVVHLEPFGGAENRFDVVRRFLVVRVRVVVAIEVRVARFGLDADGDEEGSEVASARDGRDGDVAADVLAAHRAPFGGAVDEVAARRDGGADRARRGRERGSRRGGRSGRGARGGGGRPHRRVRARRRVRVRSRSSVPSSRARAGTALAEQALAAVAPRGGVPAGGTASEVHRVHRRQEHVRLDGLRGLTPRVRRAPAQVLPGQARLRARGGTLPRADEAVVHHRGRDPPSARGVRENANAPGGAAGGGKTGACRFIARTTPRRARTRETTV